MDALHWDAVKVRHLLYADKEFELYDNVTQSIQLANQTARNYGCITFRQFSHFHRKALIHTEAVDTSVRQRHFSRTVNGTNKVVGDVVGKNIGKPVECVIKGMRICERNNNGVVCCMFAHKLSG